MSDSDVGQQNLKIVETMLANGHAGRWDIVRPLTSEDIVLHVPAGLPFGGDYRGWDGYTGLMKKIGAFFTDIKSSPREFATVGNKVIVMNRLSARIAKNGKPISFPLTDVWEIKDGKVIKITAFYYDTKAIADLAQT